MTDIAVPAKSSVILYRIVDRFLQTALRILPMTAATEAMALWWGYRFQPNPSIVKLRSGALIQTTSVDHLQLLLYYTGTFEPNSLDAMKAHVKAGSTILDVGSNIGLFSIEGAKAVGQTGTVIAIEAAPHHAALVRESAALNNMRNIEVSPVAVGDANGEATLTLPADANSGMFTLGSVPGNQSFTVPVRCIDDIVKGRWIDFIKMDIEGSEYRALLGARETIKKCHPPILIELNEDALNACGSSSRKVKELLASFGYRGSLFDGTQITMEMQHHCDECLFVAD